MFQTYPEADEIKKHAHEAVQRHTICIYYEDRYCISDEIECQYQIKYKIKLHNVEYFQWNN